MIGVLNTRPRDQAAALSTAARAAGFEPLEVPLVELVLLEKSLTLLGKLSDRNYDGILLTSPNLLPLLKRRNARVPAAWIDKPWYLIGSRARTDVEELGAAVTFIPNAASLEGFLAEIPQHPSMHPGNGLRLLHPCSAKTRLDPAIFASAGIKVHNMAVYEPRCPAGTEAALQAAWPRARAVLLASGSAVHHLFLAAPALARTLSSDDGPLPVSIGASTSRALRMYGVERFLQAPSADNAGLVEALRSTFLKGVDP